MIYEAKSCLLLTVSCSQWVCSRTYLVADCSPVEVELRVGEDIVWIDLQGLSVQFISLLCAARFESCVTFLLLLHQLFGSLMQKSITPAHNLTLRNCLFVPQLNMHSKRCSRVWRIFGRHKNLSTSTYFQRSKQKQTCQHFNNKLVRTTSLSITQQVLVDGTNQLCIKGSHPPLLKKNRVFEGNLHITCFHTYIQTFTPTYVHI